MGSCSTPSSPACLWWDGTGYYWFKPGIIDFYPPWTPYILAPFTALPWRSGLALLNALTLMTVSVATGREAWKNGRWSTIGAALFALMTPQVMMALWLGNVEGLVLLGLVALPPGVILMLIKPHLGIWALLARRKVACHTSLDRLGGHIVVDALDHRGDRARGPTVRLAMWVSSGVIRLRWSSGKNKSIR